MNVTIRPGILKGRALVPPSKSHVHRLLIAAAQCAETTLIRCPGDNEDIRATIRCLEALGASVARDGDVIRVTGPTGAPRGTLDCGESGSTLRFFLPLCAVRPADRELPAVLTGAGRLPSRPNGPLLSVLRQNGALIEGEGLPLSVSGGLRSGDYVIPGDVSSQYFTGLLFALPLLDGDSTLRYSTPLESRPYVEMTLEVLRQFGIEAEEMEDGWRVSGRQLYSSPGTAQAEADWSSAAFWLGANALGSLVEVPGLSPSSPQGDKAIGALLARIGDEIDVSQTPDIMPILTAVAAAVPGARTRITGAARLRLKESDRLSAMCEVVCALGGEARISGDELVIYGRELAGGTVDGRNDHRVVMSAAIAATVSRGPVTILGAEAANKSYPGFFETFAQLGGKIDVG